MHAFGKIAKPLIRAQHPHKEATGSLDEVAITSYAGAQMRVRLRFEQAQALVT
jgi:hypothetical protein